MNTILLLLISVVAMLAQDQDISEGHDVHRLPHQELGLSSIVSVGRTTTRNARAGVGVQWAWLLYHSSHVDLQYLAEGRPYVFFTRQNAPGSTGWCISPAGLRTTLYSRFYIESSAGLARTTLIDAERALNENKYSPIWEIGGGLQIGKSETVHVRIGYKFLRGFTGGSGPKSFDTHAIAVGISVPFGK